MLDCCFSSLGEEGEEEEKENAFINPTLVTFKLHKLITISCNRKYTLSHAIFLYYLFSFFQLSL